MSPDQVLAGSYRTPRRALSRVGLLRYIRTTLAVMLGAVAWAWIQDAGAQAYSVNMAPVYEEPGGNITRGSDASFGAESIDPFTGALKIVVTDLEVPSNGGLDLKVVRNYQSFVKIQSGVPRRDYQAGRTTTGIGWDLHFGRLWIAYQDSTAPQLVASNSNSCRVSNVTSKNNPVLELPDGSRKLFAASDSAVTGFAYITADRWILRCLPTVLNTYGDGGAIVISPDGIKYTFNWLHRASNAPGTGNLQNASTDKAFHVTKIEHPNGTSIAVNYLSKGTTYFATLNTVVHSEGQSVSFTYTGTNSPSNDGSTAHLSSFTQVGAGRTWTLNYVTAVVASEFVTNPGPYEYLESVERPDGRKTSYEYIGKVSTAPIQDGHYSLKHLTTALGGEIAYYYGQKSFPTRDASQVSPRYVVTKKEVQRHVPSSALPVGGSTDTWTYNYRPSTSASNQSDFTDISGPTECTTYEHYVGQTAGTGWKVGSLLSRTVFSPNSSPSTLTCLASQVSREVNAWAADVIANQDNYRYPLLTDGTTSAPRLNERVMHQDGRDYTTTYSNFDGSGNPQHVVETGRTTSAAGSAAASSRVTDYTYFVDLAAWILHRVKNETVRNAGTIYATPTSTPAVSDYQVTRTLFSGSKVGLVNTETRAGVTTTYDYYTGSADGGTLSLETDANGYSTSYSNYKRSLAQLTTRSIDTVSSLAINRSVNSSGTIAWQQDGELNQTSYTYNGINQLQAVTTARTDDDNVSISRTSTGSTDDVITRSSYKEVRQYDGFGMPVRTEWSDTSGSGIPPVSRVTVFDPQGRVIRQYLPNSTSSYVRTDYDALGRPKLTAQPDGSTIQYDYQTDNITRVIDERGFQTLYYNRSFGDPSKRELVRIRADRGDSPASGVYQTTHIDRNLIGQVQSVEQEGVVRTYRYNSKFFLFEENHPEVGVVSYTHDAVGNVVSRKVGTSSAANSTFDRLNRVDTVTYPDGMVVNFDYYKTDKLKLVSKGTVKWDYLYDPNNNLQQEKLTVPAAAPSFPVARTYQFDYTYDTHDARRTVAYPSGLRVDYVPNVFGQPTRVDATQGGSAVTGFATSVQYHPNGQLKSIVSSNGLSTSYGQDTRLRPSSFQSLGVVNGSSQFLVNRLYEYDATGNVSKINDYLAGGTTKTLFYDGLGRLRTATGPWGSGSATYYSNNNIQTKSFGSDALTFNYDASNKLTSVTGTTLLSFAYDVYGNATSSGRPTFGNYQFDDESLLRWVRNADGTAKIEYAHDGNRHTVLERYADGWSTKYKAYGNGVLLYEEDLVNNIAKDYIYIGTRLVSTRARCSSPQDSDADGVSDCLEFQNGLNKGSAADAAQDADGDGVSNGTEILSGLNLYTADTDSDGLNDGYEQTYGLNALVGNSNSDADGDGLTNLQEAQMGTNPTKVDTDGDGIPDNQDTQPLFNPAVLIPIISILLQ